MIHYENSDHDERRLEQWVHNNCFWRWHLPKAQAIGWDKNSIKEMIVEKLKQKSLRNIINVKCAKKK